MIKTNISHLKAHLSEKMKLVKSGREILVYERNQPVAKIIPLSAAGRASSRDDYLDSLVDQGIVSSPRAGKASRISEKDILRNLVKAKGDGVLAGFLAERAESSW